MYGVAFTICKLHNLEMSCCKIRDEGCKALSTSIVHNRTIRVLDLSSNLLTADGLWGMVAALSKNNSLEKLRLNDNRSFTLLFLSYTQTLSFSRLSPLPFSTCTSCISQFLLRHRLAHSLEQSRFTSCILQSHLRQCPAYLRQCLHVEDTVEDTFDSVLLTCFSKVSGQRRLARHHSLVTTCVCVREKDGQRQRNIVCAFLIVSSCADVYLYVRVRL